jgi:Flp pilus assembly protein TadG
MTTKKKERGAVIVESALTLIVLFMLLFATLEFGRAYKTYQVLTDAAREGARYAVAPDPSTGYNPPTVLEVQSKVGDFLVSGSVRGTTITVDECVFAPSPPPDSSVCPAGAPPITDNTLEAGNNLNPAYTRVQVTAPFSFMFFPYSVNMSTKAIMRNENN